MSTTPVWCLVVTRHDIDSSLRCRFKYKKKIYTQHLHTMRRTMRTASVKQMCLQYTPKAPNPPQYKRNEAPQATTGI